VESNSDTHVWSDSYSGVADDVFGIQEEIARKIVAGLEVTLTPKEDRQIAARPIEDVAVCATLPSTLATLPLTVS
jgi:hypothetical protein